MSDASMTELVTTCLRIEAPADRLWQNMMFYEDVPRRPPWLLRRFIPLPVRTVGDKMRVGARVHCEYEGGLLIKETTSVEAPRALRFRVVEQRLGVESAVIAVEGSYVIAPSIGGSEVRLTTRYRGFRKPRWLWRSLERFFIHALHRHVLRGLRDVAVRKDCLGGAEPPQEVRGARASTIRPGPRDAPEGVPGRPR